MSWPFWYARIKIQKGNTKFNNLWLKRTHYCFAMGPSSVYENHFSTLPLHQPIKYNTKWILKFLKLSRLSKYRKRIYTTKNEVSGGFLVILMTSDIILLIENSIMCTLNSLLWIWMVLVVLYVHLDIIVSNILYVHTNDFCV